MNITIRLRSAILIISLLGITYFGANGQPAKKKLNIDIVFIGNSITEGAQLNNPAGEAPPATASSFIRVQKKIGSVEFINQGRSGFTTVDYLPSSSGALAQVIAATKLLHKDPQRILIFSISLGTNDSAEKGPNGSPVSPADYSQNLKAITDKLLSDFPESRVFFQQPIWYSPNTYNSAKYMAAGLARLQSYFPELKLLVEKYSHSNPGHVFLGDLKGFDYFRNNFLTDLNPESGNAGTFYLHPNKKGSEVLGKFWGESIYNSLFKD
jgi:lysophospholipase L1-like esterase